MSRAFVLLKRWRIVGPREGRRFVKHWDVKHWDTKWWFGIGCLVGFAVAVVVVVAVVVWKEGGWGMDMTGECDASCLTNPTLQLFGFHCRFWRSPQRTRQAHLHSFDERYSQWNSMKRRNFSAGWRRWGPKPGPESVDRRRGWWWVSSVQLVEVIFHQFRAQSTFW